MIRSDDLIGNPFRVYLSRRNLAVHCIALSEINSQNHNTKSGAFCQAGCFDASTGEIHTVPSAAGRKWGAIALPIFAFMEIR